MALLIIYFLLSKPASILGKKNGVLMEAAPRDYTNRNGYYIVEWKVRAITSNWCAFDRRIKFTA